MRPADRSIRRASNPLKVVLAGGLAGTLLLAIIFLWLSSLGARAQARPGGVPTTAPRQAVLSARRTPDVLSFVTRTSRVRTSLAGVESRLTSDSCLSVSWLGSDLAAVRTSTPYTPGSAVKLVTAGVALEALGPDAKFTTSIRVTRNADGSVADLFVVGGGDPLIVRSEYVASEKYKTFNQTSMESIADAIVNAGVTSVSGRLVGVDTLLDAERWVAVWPASYHFTEAGPLGALMANDGAVVGQPLKPEDPAAAFVTDLSSLLAARGVAVGGGVAHEPLPEGTEELTAVSSSALTSIVNEMLVNSDNNTAEILLKHIGAKSGGTGSTAAGLKVVMESLVKWGAAEGVIVEDGSGLSPGNKIPCGAFQKILDRFKDRFPALLAVAGETGTLVNAFEDSPVKGLLRAKTGTLSGVKALVGYLPLEGDDPVRFSLILNGTGIDNRSAYRPVWQVLGNALVKASASPRPADLAP